MQRRGARISAASSIAICGSLSAVVLLAGCTSGGSSAASPSPSNPGTSSLAPSTTAGAPGTSTGNASAGTKSRSTRPVPQQSKGDVHDIVPSRTIVTRAPVGLKSVGRFDSTIAASLLSTKAIQAKAQGPGEISGPALAITVRLMNNGKHSVNLNNVVVNLAGTNGSPGTAITDSPADPFSGRLAAHRSAHAVYVFTVPTKERSRISVSISYAATTPVVVFVGNAA